jgi:hypothetical protein
MIDMTRIIVKAGLADELTKATEPAEIWDEAGKKLRSFLPQIELSECVPLSPDISDEELQRRRTSKEPRSSLAEILARLEKA